MKSYIKAIFVFNENGEKRFVDFKQGVNIITGDSKTGKSALLEIIDYCLCSSRSTIPKGKITDFGHIFCLLFVVNDKCLVIGRTQWNQGGRMFVGLEAPDFDVESLKLSYFQGKSFLPAKEVQYVIEQALGLQVSNIEVDTDMKKDKKASLRNMVSFLFQHQNLMASKFALFYRFTDYYKRQDVIDQFPIFAGIIGQEYYSSLIRLNTLKKELKQLQKLELQKSIIDKNIRDGLLPLIKDYYALLNLTFEDKNITTNQLMMLSKKMPIYDHTALYDKESKEIVEYYNVLNTEIDKLRVTETELLLKISELKNVNNVGYEYVQMLHDLKDNTDISVPTKDDYSCPLCGQLNEELNQYNSDLFEASSWLDKEVQITETYSDHFLEDIRKLEEEKSLVISKIKDKYGQIKRIERVYLNSNELINMQEKVSYAKGKIELYVETLSESMLKSGNGEIVILEEQISLLDAKVNGFNVPNRIKRAQFQISNNMNMLAKTLDFEDEFKPLDFTFDMDTFDLYHEQRNEKIFLSEMGSGANWVSCHIALFLSMLRYFAEQKERSPMPLLLFLDQPSQVYFPQGTKEILENDDEVKIKRHKDIEAVNNMYQTIFKEILDITEQTGITPQVIIVDHVDGEELLVKDTFKQNTVRDWREGRALI
jgi:hypothetical protein